MAKFEDEEDLLWDDPEEEEDELEETDEEDELGELIAASEEFVETGQSRQAIKLWRNHIDRYSDEPTAYHYQASAYLGFLQEQLGDQFLSSGEPELEPVFEQGVSAAEEALSMEPGQTETWNVLAELHLINEDLDQAADCLRKSLQIKPDQDEIREMLEEIEA